MYLKPKKKNENQKENKSGKNVPNNKYDIYQENNPIWRIPIFSLPYPLTFALQYFYHLNPNFRTVVS